MGRWEPDAEGRFRLAALELFAEVGYEQTTVAAIAERAGLTPRTFFRYFSDKREVLFSGPQVLQESMVSALAGAPADATAMDAIAFALQAPGEEEEDQAGPEAPEGYADGHYVGPEGALIAPAACAFADLHIDGDGDEHFEEGAGDDGFVHGCEAAERLAGPHD